MAFILASTGTEQTPEEAKAAAATAPADEAKETSVPAEQQGEAAPESETGESKVEATDEEAAAAKRSKGDKRFDKLTKEKADLEREREFWKKQALEGKPTDAKQPEPEVKKADTEPKEEDFSTHGEFLRAIARWEAVQLVKAEFAEQERTHKQSQAQQEIRDLYNSHDAKVKEAEGRYDDFIEVVNNPEVPLDGETGVMEFTILSSDIGADIQYYLATHIEETKAIVALKDPILISRAMGKLEAKVEATIAAKSPSEEAPKGAQSKPKPKPISPVGGSSGGNVTKSLSEVSDYGEWEKLRNEQLKKKKA